MKLTLPQQALLREAVGVAAYPASWVKEVRLGLLVQHDGGDLLAGRGPVRNDVGAGLEWHVQIPLWLLQLQSDVDARYFVPDGDDRPSDLALRAQLVHRLALPLSQKTSVFVFLDALVFVGKVEGTDEPGWNAIAGGGATFADLFRF